MRTTNAELGVEGLLAQEHLSTKQREEMFCLLSRHFEGVTPVQFAADLTSKNWVVQVRREGELLGFSTLWAGLVDVDGETITAIYSGDTIVDPIAWNSPALARTWIAAVNALRGLAPAHPCWWLLLTSGFRTYRFLPVFWRNFSPHYARPVPVKEQRLRQALAQTRYGPAFSAAEGIVRFSQPQTLRARLAQGANERALDPHIAHFLRLNPGHTQGDELVCLTRIDEENLTAAGRRMVQRR